ncbi:MAG TPA: hypothetical protein VEV13_08120 [Candidatus Limnocylindria bacterium]|nr:hypothetical protein [Candidatus Limnocylindria bacterium]
MTLHTLPLGGPALTGLRLRPNAVAVPALSSHVRPALVLAEKESRSLLDAAKARDVSQGGVYCSSPIGIQVWDRAWASAEDPGGAVQLGSVDWSYDSPVKHYVTIYRAMITADGVAAGVTTLSLLTSVLGLSGIPVDGARVSMPAPPARDPFRRPV